MNFNSSQPIYLQIAEYLCDAILSEKWKADQRIPSVRELGSSLEVNPNTVVRGYEQLERDGAIYNKRGVGFFVSADAKEKITAQRRKAFLEDELPRLAIRMKQLDISIEELTERISQDI